MRKTKLALDMGVPIYGILGFTATATDKIGRSVPAPGQGILTTAREIPSRFPSPLLDMKYRKRQMDLRRQNIKQWQESELMYLQEEVTAMKASGESFNEADYMQDRAQHITREARRQEKEALNSLGNNFWKQDPRIAPLRGALATWGLTIDDLRVASFHGTSTVANDKNESEVICEQMRHLGRQKGNALLGVFQKYLTGHPKGAAGAFMFNGCLQILSSGLVPGNRNADNVDQALEKYDMIVYPSRSIQTDGVKAFSVTSFGFGQKGAQAIGIHPRYLYATLDEATYTSYAARVSARQKKAYRYFHDGLINNSMFRAKDRAPYPDDQMKSVFLNPEARVTSAPGKKTSVVEYSFPAKKQQPTKPQKLSPASPPSTAAPPSPNTADATREMAESLARAAAAGQTGANTRVGIDVEALDAVNIHNETFVERNFTTAERDYCKAAASPRASFAGRWSAKEAVFKSLGVASKGAGAPLKEIEVLAGEGGAPVIKVSSIYYAFVITPAHDYSTATW